jgi:hypothetical protein
MRKLLVLVLLAAGCGSKGLWREEKRYVTPYLSGDDPFPNVREYYVRGSQCGFYWHRGQDQNLVVAYAAGTLLNEMSESEAKDKIERMCD